MSKQPGASIDFRPKYHYHGKPCIKCGSDVRFIKFDGCVKCRRIYDRQRHKSRKEYSNSWRSTNNNYMKNHGRNWRINNPDYVIPQHEWRKDNQDKILAYKAVHSAINSGNIPKASELKCYDSGQFCTEQASDYHHESYLPEHWLDVVPLCQSCHKARHNK